MAHAKMLERTLFYTEWTRAQQILILVGEREAIQLAVETVSATSRRTRLRAFLGDALAGLAPAAPAAEKSAPVPSRFSGLRQRGSVAEAPAPVAVEQPATRFSGLRGRSSAKATAAPAPASAENAPAPQAVRFSGLRGAPRRQSATEEAPLPRP
jgi:exodeoxyribonuclease V alpha subunit